jgi:hypothetical protein
MSPWQVPQNIHCSTYQMLYPLLVLTLNSMFTSNYAGPMLLRAAAVVMFGLFAALLVASPSNAAAATYGYVDALGEVKSVTANDWMTAIAIAPNIDIHSGVMLLVTAADYMVIGDTVESVK